MAPPSTRIQKSRASRRRRQPGPSPETSASRRGSSPTQSRQQESDDESRIVGDGSPQNQGEHGCCEELRGKMDAHFQASSDRMQQIEEQLSQIRGAIEAMHRNMKFGFEHQEKRERALDRKQVFAELFKDMRNVSERCGMFRDMRSLQRHEERRINLNGGN